MAASYDNDNINIVNSIPTGVNKSQLCQTRRYDLDLVSRHKIQTALIDTHTAPRTNKTV